MRVAFLGHDQPLGLRPSGGYLSSEDAERLVHELAAERITQTIIRAFPPTSTFSCRVLEHPFVKNYIPRRLPPKEVANVKFVPPPLVVKDCIRRCYLPRFREVYGANQLAASL